MKIQIKIEPTFSVEWPKLRLKFNDEISTMVVDGKEDELKFHDSLGVVEHPFEESETDESQKNKQRKGNQKSYKSQFIYLF